MEFAMRGFEILRRDVGIDLRCRKIRVSQQHLQGPQAHAGLHEVSRERVTEDVRRESAGNACGLGQDFECLPKTLASQSFPPSTEKESILNGQTRVLERRA